MGEKIIADAFESGSVTFSVRPGSKRPTVCHLYAKHEDAIRILGPSFANGVNLSHYDDALATGGSGAEFFISATDKSSQWELLRQAFNINPKLGRVIHEPQQNTTSKDCPVSYFESQINTAVNTAIELIKQHLSAQKDYERKYDPVRDYGYLATFLLVRDLVGLKMPSKPSFAYRTFSFLRSLHEQKSSLLAIPEIHQANELIMWIEVMFGHLFMNPGDHNKPLMMASRFISKRYIRTIEESLKNPPENSLIHRMNSAPLANEIPKHKYYQLATNIVMELVGSFQYLSGRAFAGIVKTIEEEFANSIEPSANSLATFNSRITLNARATLDEAMRHNSPTGFIFRRASKDFEYKGLQVAKGDLMCVMCDKASKDPSVFETPEKFLDLETSIKHQNDYLAFGSPDFNPAAFKPHNEHHPCFGQYMARTILVKMLKGLEQLPRHNPHSNNGTYIN